MTPAYNAARGYRRHQYNGGRSYRRRGWGFFTRSGSMLSGSTPQYFGAGQPVAEVGGSLLGGETPDYLANSSLATGAQSVTSGDATELRSEPQGGQMAIVVPRS
jgi:hypothetical protein